MTEDIQEKTDFLILANDDELQADLDVYDDQTTKLPENKEESLSRAKLLFDLVNQLRSGKDAWRISLPCQLLTSSSMLEYATFFVTPNDYILNIASQMDPEQRMLTVLRWWCSNLSRGPAKGIRHTKPYNPVLGEVFAARYDHKDYDCSTYYISEQVSHHPPISSFYVTNRKKNFSVKGTLFPKTKFHGNSASMVIDGPISIFIHNLKEEYKIELPNFVGYGLLYGSQRVEINEKLRITCEQTGYTCECSYKSKSSNKFTGKIECKGKKIWKLSGVTNDKIYLKNCETKKTSLFLDASDIQHNQPTCKPLPQQADNESRKIWHKLTVNLKKSRDYTEATKNKNAIEEYQREVRSRREKEGVVWKSKFFLPVSENVSDGYNCIFENFQPYDENEEDFSKKHSIFQMDIPTQI